MTIMVIPVEAPTKSINKTVATKLPPFKVAVHIDTEVLHPEVARRKANAWLLLYAGHLLRADNPELIWEDGVLLWRYDVLLTNINYGTVGKIACIRVDAATGEVLADQSVRHEWNANARELLQQKGLPVLAEEDDSDETDEDVLIYAT
jgi:hypothetical protein